MIALLLWLLFLPQVWGVCDRSDEPIVPPLCCLVSRSC